MLTDNPEFRRNLWLSATPGVLATVPLVTGAIFLTVGVMTKDYADFMGAMSYICILGLSVTLLVVGAKMMSDSLAGEVTARTWDSQRMTSLSPGRMTAGKLFGSTILCWYTAAVLVPFFLWAASERGFLDRGVIFVVNTILSGVLIQAVCGIAVLAEMRRAPQGMGIKHSGLYLIIGVIFLVQSLPSAFNFLEPNMRMGEGILKWYSIEFPAGTFQMLSYAVFAFWAVYGLYRNMRVELLHENGPWAWVFFVLTCMVYTGGFGVEDNVPFRVSAYNVFFLAFVTAASWTYLMAFSEPKNPVDVKSLLEKYREGDLVTFFRRIPRWILSLALAALACLGVLAFFPAYTRDYGLSFLAGAGPLLALAILVFMVRDIGIIFFWYMKPNPRRPDVAILVTFLVAYGILPLVVSAGGESTKALGMFMPVLKGPAVLRLVPALVMAAGAWWLALKRFKALIAPNKLPYSTFV